MQSLAGQLLPSHNFTLDKEELTFWWSIGHLATPPPGCAVSYPHLSISSSSISCPLISMSTTPGVCVFCDSQTPSRLMVDLMQQFLKTKLASYGLQASCLLLQTRFYWTQCWTRVRQGRVRQVQDWIMSSFKFLIFYLLFVFWHQFWFLKHQIKILFIIITVLMPTYLQHPRQEPHCFALVPNLAWPFCQGPSL